MELHRDFRNAILLLVQEFKKYQVRALSRNNALARIMELDREERADLTAAQILRLVSEATKANQRLVDESAAGLEKALLTDKDVLDWLKGYCANVILRLEQ